MAEAPPVEVIANAGLGRAGLLNRPLAKVLLAARIARLTSIV
jgi:hypothetical protein